MPKILTILVFLTLVFISNPSFALEEKIPLNHSVYENWKYMSDPKISNNGKYISYEMNQMHGDGFLVFYNNITSKKDSIPRGANNSFSNNSDFAVFRIKPEFCNENSNSKPDSLGIYKFSNNSLNKFHNLESFKMAKDSSSYLLFLYKDSINVSKNDSVKNKKQVNKLVISNPPKSIFKEFLFVNCYDISDNGNLIGFVQNLNDSTDSCKVVTYNTKNNKFDTIYKSNTQVNKIAIDKLGDQIAFITKKDSTGSENFLSVWRKNDKMPYFIDPCAELNRKDWTVSSNGDLSFSYDRQKLFFGLAPIKYVEDTVKSEYEYNLDLWHWKDPYLQSYQKRHMEDELKRSYLTSYNLSNGNYTQIEDSLRRYSTINRNISNKFTLVKSYLPYAISNQWNSSYYRDYYLIDLDNGNKEIIAQKTQNIYHLSPANKYLYWFDRDKQIWFTQDVKTKKKYNLTEQLQVNFFNEYHDRPSKPYSYGVSGWTENDEYLFIYDKYDVWKIDPEMKESPINLTSGRDSLLIYRFIDLDESDPFLKNISYLKLFDDENKDTGYAKINIKNNSLPKLLVVGPYIFYSLNKSKNKPSFIWRKMSFEKYSDLFISDINFKKIKKVTYIDKQKENYLWGTSELVSWKTSTGSELEGILYKPENFDPKKKYPLIVKIYERTSNRLHSNYSVKPSRAIINYPFYVSNGYIVFKPDIKYGTGHPGEDALESVVSGVQHLIRKGYIDENNIGLIGHSWGGYETAYIITQTDIFDAAMAGAPVSNMTSAYGGIRWGSGKSRQKQYEDGQSRLGESLWENRELYINNSPLFFADSIKTPLLILHNDNDGAVPWTQGIELFLALRRLQKPVWLLNYNDEKHSLRKWDNRVDYSKRLFQFFNHYLKNEAAPDWLKYGIPVTRKSVYDGY